MRAQCAITLLHLIIDSYCFCSDQEPIFTRRPSVQQGIQGSRSSLGLGSGLRHQSSNSGRAIADDRAQQSLAGAVSNGDSDDDADDLTPLISTSGRERPPHLRNSHGYGGAHTTDGRVRQRSSSSSRFSRKGRSILGQESLSQTLPGYDVNNPPSVPTSPHLAATLGFDDVMLMGDETRVGSSDGRCASTHGHGRDAIIDIDESGVGERLVGSLPASAAAGRRRNTIHPAEADVCFPAEGLSELGDQDFLNQQEDGASFRPRRRRSRRWPDLRVLEAWSVEEKEQRTMEGIRAKTISEPVLVGGRLRPQKTVWHRQTEDEPYRWTYFNETFESTIHSQTISELLQPGQTFKDLFIPEPTELTSDSSEDDEEDMTQTQSTADDNGDRRHRSSSKSQSDRSKNQSPKLPERTATLSQENGPGTPAHSGSQTPNGKAKRYGERPTFWLDVLSPTEPEMRVMQRAFGIHGLTVEDIMMQEDREKVELFRNYYFVSYRSFEQDTNSENYMEPINIYVVVFREGVISVWIADPSMLRV